MGMSSRSYGHSPPARLPQTAQTVLKLETARPLPALAQLERHQFIVIVYRIVIYGHSPTAPHRAVLPQNVRTVLKMRDCAGRSAPASRQPKPGQENSAFIVMVYRDDLSRWVTARVPQTHTDAVADRTECAETAGPERARPGTGGAGHEPAGLSRYSGCLTPTCGAPEHPNWGKSALSAPLSQSGRSAAQARDLK